MSPLHWIRHRCHMGGGAAADRVAVGERILTSEMIQGLSVWRQFQLANALQGERAHEIAIAGDALFAFTTGGALAAAPAGPA